MRLASGSQRWCTRAGEAGSAKAAAQPIWIAYHDLLRDGGAEACAGAGGYRVKGALGCWRDL
jgi:hypothetical protein